MFKRLWSWITGWFAGSPKNTPSVDKPAQTITPEKTQQEIYDDSWEADVQFTANQIAVYAENYEQNQQALYDDMSENPKLFAAAAGQVNWSEVIRSYSDKTLHVMLEYGTNFAFSPSLRKKILDISAAERGARSSTHRPDMNGMADDGGQR